MKNKYQRNPREPTKEHYTTDKKPMSSWKKAGLVWLMAGAVLAGSATKIWADYKNGNEMSSEPVIQNAVYYYDSEENSQEETPTYCIVEEKDTLSGIALESKIPLKKIIKANPGIIPNKIKIGQKINLSLEGMVEEAQDTEKTNISETNSNYSISSEGLDLIKSKEGFRATRYLDIDKWAIGYGHNIKEGENYSKISKNKAEEILLDDVEKMGEKIQELVQVKLNQNQYDALCSFVYNVGPGSFENSKLLKYLNKGNYEMAAKEFPKWSYAKNAKTNKPEVKAGLKQRRLEEKRLFEGN